MRRNTRQARICLRKRVNARAEVHRDETEPGHHADAAMLELGLSEVVLREEVGDWAGGGMEYVNKGELCVDGKRSVLVLMRNYWLLNVWGLRTSPVADLASRRSCQSPILPVADLASRRSCQSPILPVANLASRRSCQSRILPVTDLASRMLVGSIAMRVYRHVQPSSIPVKRAPPTPPLVLLAHTLCITIPGSLGIRLTSERIEADIAYVAG